jgi:vacuolar-type H+-ATPase subunit C/Vma6
VAVLARDFVYGNTRLRSRRSELLRGADYERLLGRDVDGLLGVLKTTPYAADVEASSADDGREGFHDMIRVHLTRSLLEMRSFYTGRAGELVDLLLARFDVHNVIAVLRSHAHTSGPGEHARAPLIGIGWVGGALADEILDQGELAGAVDVLARSSPDREQGRALRAAFEQYERTEDLPAFERGVAGAHVQRTAVALSGAGRAARSLLRLTRREIDDRNLLIALRLRDTPAPDAGAEELLHAGGSVPPPRILAAAQTAAPATIAAQLGRHGAGSWGAPLTQWAATGNLLALEHELQHSRIEASDAMFVAGDQLSIDVPIAFTAAQRSEARNLRLLGEASARGIPVETVRRELLWPRAAG